MESKVAFVYSSQGAQWPGMGLRLYRQEPVFRCLITACSEVIEEQLGWSLVDEFSGKPSDVRFHTEADRVQPAITALQIALSALYLDRRFRPAAVAGLSMGELAACHTAGIMGLRDAMNVACCQAILTRQTLRPGRMAIVNLSVSGLRDLLQRSKSLISVAVELSPTMTVISGQESQIRQVISYLEARNIRCGMVRIKFAFHSPEVAPLFRSFAKLLAPFEVQEGLIPMYSSVAGQLQGGASFHRDYWWRIFCEPARFLSTTRAMLSDNHRVFLEIGPHPTLLAPIAETAASRGIQVRTIGSMHRDRDPLAVLQASCDLLNGHNLGDRSEFQRS